MKGRKIYSALCHKNESMKRIIMAILLIANFTACLNKKDEGLNPSQENIEMSEVMFPKPKIAIKTIGILLYDGYTTLDAMGPYQILGGLMGVNVFFVGRTKGLIANQSGMKTLCDTSIFEVKQLDILVIPGGMKETYLATKDTVLLNWIKSIDENSKYTTSVCTGAWILGATGLLNGVEATTHWYGKKILAEEFGAKVQDKRFVKSGKYWTSAGVTAGMDMSLELIREINGDKYTQVVMLDLEYDPKPPFPGGSEKNTDSEIVEGVRSMYDGGMESVLNPDKVIHNLKIVNKKDFICGMEVTADVSDTVIYNGEVYGFCSSFCKDKFKKNPSSYLVAE